MYFIHLHISSLSACHSQFLHLRRGDGYLDGLLPKLAANSEGPADLTGSRAVSFSNLWHQDAPGLVCLGVSICLVEFHHPGVRGGVAQPFHMGLAMPVRATRSLGQEVPAKAGSFQQIVGGRCLLVQCQPGVVWIWSIAGALASGPMTKTASCHR